MGGSPPLDIINKCPAPSVQEQSQLLSRRPQQQHDHSRRSAPGVSHEAESINQQNMFGWSPSVLVGWVGGWHAVPEALVKAGGHSEGEGHELAHTACRAFIKIERPLYSSTPAPASKPLGASTTNQPATTEENRAQSTSHHLLATWWKEVGGVSESAAPEKPKKNPTQKPK